MFAGRYKNKIDDKGRIVIPKAFREIEDGAQWGKGVLTCGLDGCLFLYALGDWKKLISSESLQTAGLPDLEMMRFQRLFAGSGHIIDVDQFNRIVVPQELRQEAGLERECVWLGAINRAELWSAKGWSDYRAKHKDILENTWDRISKRGQAEEANDNVGATVTQGKVKGE